MVPVGERDDGVLVVDVVAAKQGSVRVIFKESRGNLPVTVRVSRVIHNHRATKTIAVLGCYQKVECQHRAIQRYDIGHAQ